MVARTGEIPQLAHGAGRDLIEAFPVVDFANFRSAAVFIDTAEYHDAETEEFPKYFGRLD
jgi:hypothetical protein